MKLNRLLLTLILIAAPATNAEDLAGKWETSLDEDNILVESRKSQNTSYDEFRATMIVSTGLAPAIALLQDTSACSDWIFRCKESAIIQAFSKTERTFYQITTLPFPAKARDVIFYAEITFLPNGAILVSMTARPDALPETKHIRVREAYGTYTLTPLAEGKTRVIWEQYVDPEGKLPAWLVNSMLTDLPYKSLKRFRQKVMTAPYSTAGFIYDDNDNPVGINF
ncbi:MAG: hypothetical protein ACI8Z1_003690 [Candidatus Azotimanducaceae bacterium]|jgi:hypothetical protein